MLSVIIPTFNNVSSKQGSLAIVLESLNQNADMVHEVIVVDSGSTDETKEFVQRSADLLSFPLHVVQPLRKRNRSAARNAGLKQASGPLVLFVDDDTFCEPGILARLDLEERSDCFWTCPRRAYLPLDVPNDAILQKIRSHRFRDLHDMSTVVPGRQRRSQPWHIAYAFSFVANFGIVSQDLVRQVGGFNEAFAGWGHEDVELMSRLLERARVVNLYNRAVVFHLDHLISPYQWVEHEQTAKVLREQLDARNVKFDILSFAKEVVSGEDIPRKATGEPQSRTIGNESVYPVAARALENVSYLIEQRTVPIGAFVVGSAVSSESPRDVDLLVIGRYGDHTFLETYDVQLGLKVDLELLPLSQVDLLRQCHVHRPRDWLLEIGKWAHSGLLMDQDGIVDQARERVVQLRDEQRVFTLTYALGRLQILQEKFPRATRNSWPWFEGLRCVNYLRFVGEQHFPRAEGDLFMERDVAKDLDDLCATAESIVQRWFSEPPSPKLEVACHLPENFAGLDRLKRRFPEGWSGCTSVQWPVT